MVHSDASGHGCVAPRKAASSNRRVVFDRVRLLGVGRFFRGSVLGNFLRYSGSGGEGTVWKIQSAGISWCWWLVYMFDTDDSTLDAHRSQRT